MDTFHVERWRPYSVMNVSLAVQTLSSTTAIALRNYYDTETHRTAEFCDMMNSFFNMFKVAPIEKS